MIFKVKSKFIIKREKLIKEGTMSKEIDISELLGDYISSLDGDIRINEKYGTGGVKQISFNDNFTLHNMNFTLNQDLHLHAQANLSVSTFSSFNKGYMRYENLDSGKKCHFTPNHTHFISTNRENGISFYEKNQEMDIYFFMVNKDFILPILQKSKSKELQILAKKWDSEDIFDMKILHLNAEDMRKLYRFKDFGFDDELEKIFLTSTAYDLLHNWLKSYDDERLPHEEIKYICMVEEYILDNLQSEFSLKHLARIAKTNEKKLQRNFKIHFGENIFEYILKKRMQQAKILLKSKDYNINEVARKVGYRHQGNFSRMFYRYFKVLPKDMKNA